MNLDECFKKRLLRRERPDQQRAQRSIQVALAKLEQAEKAYSHELYDAALVLAYTSMFHAARGLLSRDGIVEKSHVCLVEYLREEYARKGRISEGLVNSLDRLRTDRHEAIYGLETTIQKDQAGHSLKQSREFIEDRKKPPHERRETKRARITLTPQEYRERRTKRDPFITEILKQKRISLVEG